MAEVKLSVIIPVYNGARFISSCFDALSRQSCNSGVEVLLVDNASSDSTMTLASAYYEKIPALRILSETSTQSSYAARNLGIKNAKGEFLAFTDIDCRPDEDWFDNCLALAGSSDARTIVSGEVRLFPEKQRFNLFELYDRYSSLRQEVYSEKNYGATANLLVPAEVFKAVGDFQVVESGGDQEFCRRAVRNGVLFKYKPTMRVFHPARSAYGDLIAKAKRVGRGFSQNIDNLYPDRLNRLKFVLRQLVGIVFPRHQLHICRQVFSENNLSRLEKIKFFLVAVSIGNSQRVSFLMSFASRQLGKVGRA
jgi:glycosyltransferase involved in cell wall biosynthesis